MVPEPFLSILSNYAGLKTCDLIESRMSAAVNMDSSGSTGSYAPSLSLSMFASLMMPAFLSRQAARFLQTCDAFSCSVSSDAISYS
jgi:hypothetical protein